MTLCNRKVQDIFRGKSFPCGNPKRKTGDECKEHRASDLKQARAQKLHEIQVAQRMQNEKLAVLRRLTDEELETELTKRKDRKRCGP